MTYEETDTLKLIGKQSVGIVPEEAKEQIYDVATFYYNNMNIGLSELLRFGTDMFILGYLQVKRGENNAIS